MEILCIVSLPYMYRLISFYWHICSHNVRALLPFPGMTPQMDIKATWPIKHAFVTDQEAAYSEERLEQGWDYQTNAIRIIDNDKNAIISYSDRGMDWIPSITECQYICMKVVANPSGIQVLNIGHFAISILFMVMAHIFAHPIGIQYQ